MKLCTCNQCGGVYEDMNPQTGAKEYADYQFIQPLIRIRGEAESDGDKFDEFWACPVCKDDGNLSDNIEPTKEIIMEVIHLINDNMLNAWEDDLENTRQVAILEDFSNEPEGDVTKYNGWYEKLLEFINPKK